MTPPLNQQNSVRRMKDGKMGRRGGREAAMDGRQKSRIKKNGDEAEKMSEKRPNVIKRQ